MCKVSGNVKFVHDKTWCRAKTWHLVHLVPGSTETTSFHAESALTSAYAVEINLQTLYPHLHSHLHPIQTPVILIFILFKLLSFSSSSSPNCPVKQMPLSAANTDKKTTASARVWRYEKLLQHPTPPTPPTPPNRPSFSLKLGIVDSLPIPRNQWSKDIKSV